MNKIMATAAILVAATSGMTTAMAAPGWSDSPRGHEIQGAYVAGRIHGADRYRHYGYGRTWHRGERFAPYDGRVEVLRGYGYGHGFGAGRLYVPPRGAQWVRVNDDALLTAIATGVVLDVVYNLQF